MDITIIKWTKIWTKIIELFDLVNDYSTPEELIKQLDNKYSNDERLQLLAYLNGYIDHKKVIDLLVDSFYARDGKNCLRKDRSLYLVLSCFIVYFHDEDNHFDLLNSIDNSSYKERFVKFLKYLLNEKSLLTYIKYTWLTLYNDDYVDANLIKPILNNIQKYDRFTNEEREMFSVNETKSKSATIPVPFNFIGNKARKILLPEPLAQHDFEPKFSKTKKAKRRSISANFNSLEYYDNPKKKKEKNAFLKQSVNRSEPSPNEENTFSKERQFKATPFTFKKNTIPVKLNTALILKEENLVREKIQKFCEQWGDEEREIKNANNYWEWRREVRSEELKNELDKLDALRMMSKQSFEGAITARNNLVFYRREQARLIELEENELCRLGDEKARLLLKARQEAANSSRELRENCRVAKEKIFTARRINANQISDLSKQFENKALKKAEQDMKNRIDLIQAIKSSESASMGRQKLVDLGKPGGHGLLSEMSLTELKERVELMRQEVDWARKEKHDQIIREKREWDSARLEKLQYVNSSRQGLNLPDNEIITNMSLKEVLNNHKQSSNLNQQQSIKPMNALDERLNSIDVARRHQQYLFYSHYRDFLEKKRLEDMERHYEKTSSVLYQKSL